MLEKCNVGRAGGAQCRGEGVHDDVYDGAIRTRFGAGIWWQERMMSRAESSRVRATASQAGSKLERSAQSDSRSSERVGAAPNRGRGIHSSRREDQATQRGRAGWIWQALVGQTTAVQTRLAGGEGGEGGEGGAGRRERW